MKLRVLLDDLWRGGFTLWRDRDPKNESFETQIHIQKIRRKHLGQVGVTKLRYEYSTGRYHEL